MYNNVYQAATDAYAAELQYCQEFVPFALWLERKKNCGFYWGA